MDTPRIPQDNEVPRLFGDGPRPREASDHCTPTHHVHVLLLKPLLPRSCRDDGGPFVEVERKLIYPASPLSLPSVVRCRIRSVVVDVTELLQLMQEVIFSIRLVDDRSSAAEEEPALGRHDAKRLVLHSMNTWCCEDLAQLGYGSLSEAHASKVAPYVPCST